MRHLIEQHLEAIGPRRSLLLTIMTIVWASIALAVAVWALAKGLMETLWITLAVAGLGPSDIAVALTLWAFLGLSVPLLRACIRIYRDWRDERWEANAALNEVEATLTPPVTSTRHLAGPRDRLALHGLEMIETRRLGAPRNSGEAFETRLIALRATPR